MSSGSLKDLIGAYFCFIVVGAFELVLMIKMFSGKNSNFTTKILMLLVFALVFAIASAQLKYFISNKNTNNMLLLVSSSVCVFLYSTTSSLAYWVYSCQYQKLSDTFYSVSHAGAKGCFQRAWWIEIVGGVLVVTLELAISINPYFSAV